MYHLKLSKGLSYYGGGIKATKKNPDVYVEDEASANAALASGYFKLVSVSEEQEVLPSRRTGHLDKVFLEDMDNDELKKLAADMGVDATGLSHKELAERVAAETIEYDPPTDEEIAQGSSPGKTLDKMTVSELETFATYKGVSLKGVRGKDNIIAALKEALGAEETENEVDYGSPTMVELQEQ